jgi:SsrA-binding protein
MSALWSYVYYTQIIKISFPGRKAGTNENGAESASRIKNTDNDHPRYGQQIQPELHRYKYSILHPSEMSKDVRISTTMTLYAENKKARFDYEILDTLQAGLALKGYEVKAIRAKRADLTDSYAVMRHGEIMLLNAKIHPLQPRNLRTFTPDRTRRLLVTKQELKRITGRLKAERLTLIPLRLYNKADFIKLELGLARNRHRFQKRDLLRRRALDREMERSFKTKR